MSRVGKYPVAVPDGVTVTMADGMFTAKGKLGEMSMAISDMVEVNLGDKEIVTKPKVDDKKSRMMWGTMRAQIDNIVHGVGVGFTKKLEITGVGYRAQVQGNTLKLALGFSHDVDFPIPEDLDIKCPSQTEIEISGASKQRVGQIASEIRAYRPPEPYKGKGVRYAGEQILRKEGKKK